MKMKGSYMLNKKVTIKDLIKFNIWCDYHFPFLTVLLGTM